MGITLYDLGVVIDGNGVVILLHKLVALREIRVSMAIGTEKYREGERENRSWGELS